MAVILGMANYAYTYVFQFLFSASLRTIGFIYIISPHIQTIRERMTLGKFGKPVSARQLNRIFAMNKEVLDQAVELESGCLSHFEVFNCRKFWMKIIETF